MKYETPQLTALSAINAIQQTHPTFKSPTNPLKENSAGRANSATDGIERNQCYSAIQLPTAGGDRESHEGQQPT